MGMNKTLGLLGCGNMGSAIVQGAIQAGALEGRQVFLFDIDKHKAESLAEAIQGTVVGSTSELMAQAEMVLLAVKPQGMQEVLEEIAPLAKDQHLFLSVAAGLPVALLEGALGEQARVIRVMPNTPALLGCGMSALARGSQVHDEEMAAARCLFETVGKVTEVEDCAMDAVTGVSGSGPAYVFRMVEVLAQGGEKMGLPEETALELARQTLLGAARMVTETDTPPEELRRRVTSPQGTTEAGLKSMEKDDFSGLMARAVEAATLRGKEIGQQMAAKWKGE